MPEIWFEKAERLAQEGFATPGWADAELAARRKGDPGTLRLAARL